MTNFVHLESLREKKKKEKEKESLISMQSDFISLEVSFLM